MDYLFSCMLNISVQNYLWSGLSVPNGTEQNYWTVATGESDWKAVPLTQKTKAALVYCLTMLVVSCRAKK